MFFILSWLASDYYDLNLFSYLLLSEITVIPLNLKSYFKFLRYRKAEIFFGLLTYFLFFVFRVVNISYNFIYVLTEGHYELSYLFIPLLSLQYYWFYLMSLKFKSVFIDHAKKSELKE